jgi:single-stranded-DNA-specific exonuclease
VPGIHIRDVLDSIAARSPELISRFGGHAMAAGLTLEECHLDAFARAFDAEVANWRDPSIPSNRVETDGELTSEEIALETAQALRDGGPWGQAFPEPCFDGRFAVRNARVVGEKHLTMWVSTQDQARSFDAIAFNFKGSEELPKLPDGEVHLVYRLDINEYRGERRLQLLVDHVLP